MSRSVLRWAASLALLPLAAQAAELFVPGSLNDPRVRSAQYLERDDRHFSAIVELLQADARGDAAAMPQEYQWRLAEAYLGFGMGDKAEAIYRGLAQRPGDAVVATRAQMRLAEFQYQRGYVSEARATLYRLRERLPESLVVDWQDLLSRVLMAEGRYGEAAEVLTELDNARQQSQYSRYNLGVALINDGRAAQGRTVLDRVGRLSPQTEEDLALRDRANLSLGWHFLQSQMGGTAKPVFSRVRLEGPFSNRALLGLGWSELAPQGARVERVEVGDDKPDAGPFSTFSTLGVLLRPGFLEDDVFKRAGLRSFRLKKGKPEDEEALRRALVPWVTLIGRDPMDPAVQEAWLAIPFSLDRLGAHTQALQYYEKAIGVLDAARKRQTEAMNSIRQGRMVETIVRRELDSEASWEWKLKDLPDAPETYFLQSLLAEHRFQETLKNYRDLRLMGRVLDGWQQRLDTAEKAWVDAERLATPAEVTVKRARQSWVEPWSGLKIRLQADTALAAPGTYDDRLLTDPPPPWRLRTTELPGRFDGPMERAQALRGRLDNLRSLVKTASDAQSRLLREIALKELDGQRKQIERYLVEARFALARLYDRQKKGELE